MKPLIINPSQTQFLTGRIISLFRDCLPSYREKWRKTINSKKGDLALILQKLYPDTMINIFLEFKAKYPELDYEYVVDFLSLDQIEKL